VPRRSPQAFAAVSAMSVRWWEPGRSTRATAR
jgi:hypothetical protein